MSLKSMVYNRGGCPHFRPCPATAPSLSSISSIKSNKSGQLLLQLLYQAPRPSPSSHPTCCTKPQQLSRPLSQSQAKAFAPLVLYQISAQLPSPCLSTTPHPQVFITRVKNRFQILRTISNKKVSISSHVLLHEMNIICTKT